MPITPARLKPHEAFNFGFTESIIILDTCTHPLQHNKTIPGGAFLDVNLPIETATVTAINFIMVEFPPDIRSSALLLYDDETRMEEVFRVLLTTDSFRKVYAVSRADLYSNFRSVRGWGRQ
mmetsp:Transcript_5022/g.10044  ORF Transcript_5022/g.10044 Transcript_5022/m.10044 type:complete len:121 (-) Transcript_5022:674-1036(-)